MPHSFEIFFKVFVYCSKSSCFSFIVLSECMLELNGVEKHQTDMQAKLATENASDNEAIIL